MGSIHILVDNKAAEGFVAEHGFALWISVDGRQILFDTGNREALVPNTRKLNLDFTNLTDLGLWDNRISDISTVSDLANLTHLSLGENEIADISPLEELPYLMVLNLSNNDLNDVSPLARLTELALLYLDGNDISDISALAGLVNLEWLYLASNGIMDISPLSNLTDLRELDLRKNFLDRDAYCDLETLGDSNPGMKLGYDPCPYPPAQVSASAGSHSDRVLVVSNS